MSSIASIVCLLYLLHRHGCADEIQCGQTVTGYLPANGHHDYSFEPSRHKNVFHTCGSTTNFDTVIEIRRSDTNAVMDQTGGYYDTRCDEVGSSSNDVASYLSWDYGSRQASSSQGVYTRYIRVRGYRPTDSGDFALTWECSGNVISSSTSANASAVALQLGVGIPLLCLLVIGITIGTYYLQNKKVTSGSGADIAMSATVTPKTPPRNGDTSPIQQRQQQQEGGDTAAGAAQGSLLEAHNEDMFDIDDFFHDKVQLGDENGRYVEMFRNDGFDQLSTIQYVTDEELVNMGVDKKGHRLHILAAIQSLKEPKVTNY